MFGFLLHVGLVVRNETPLDGIPGAPETFRLGSATSTSD